MKGKTIAVVGPHYSGKTTLCRIFEEKFGYKKIEERWQDDPYRTGEKRDYFRSQVWYLLQTTQAIYKAKQLNKRGENVILDTLYYSTLIFAQTKLDKRDFDVFKDLVDLVARSAPMPDVIVYLHAEVDFLFNTRKNIRVAQKTGPSGEDKTPYEWLKKVCELHDFYFENWKKTKLIKINVEKEDLAADPKAIDSLFNKITE